jgi:hypothetical protein
MEFKHGEHKLAFIFEIIGSGRIEEKRGKTNE